MKAKKKINWSKVPYVLLLTVFWFTMKMTEMDMSAGSFLGITLVIACVIVMLAEFIKSMDIGIRSFKIDLALSVFTTVFATALITRYVHLGNLCFADGMIGFTVLVDAWVSPVGSFAMALRNIQGNVGTETNTEAQ